MSDHRRNGPVIVVQQPNPIAWQIALRLAGGDVSRLRTDPDGSILVLNNGESQP
jgi:hypothetical protein